MHQLGLELLHQQQRRASSSAARRLTPKRCMICSRSKSREGRLLSRRHDSASRGIQLGGTGMLDLLDGANESQTASWPSGRLERTILHEAAQYSKTILLLLIMPLISSKMAADRKLPFSQYWSFLPCPTPPAPPISQT